MSGRKQHFIPQSLLRGFSANQSGKNTQVLVFKSDQEPYLANTKDVAAKRHFYSELSSSNQGKTLDDLITDYEDNLAKLLQELRDSADNGPVNGAIAAELVTHLTMRADFIRNVFGLGVREIIAGSIAFFSEPESMRSLLGIDDEQPASIFIEELEKVVTGLRSNLPAEISESLLRRILSFLVREEFETIKGRHFSGLSSVFNQLASQIPTLIRNGHIQALERSVAPEPRIQSLEQLNWTVINVPDANLILPDCVAISFSSSENHCSPHVLESNAEDFEQVFLPISSSQLLVGRRDPSKIVALDQFNRRAAACSAEFFVSSINTPEIASYATDIGEESKQKVLSIARKAVEGLYGSSGAESATGHFSGTGVSSTNITFSISFNDSEHLEWSGHFVTIMEVIVRELAKQMPLNRIGSVTLTGNYKEAIRTIDRRFLVSQILEPSEEESHMGIIIAPLMMVDGKIMSHIVADSWLGHALLNLEDDESFQIALYAFVTALAGTAFLELVDTALPDVLQKPLEDRWSGMLFKHIYNACNSYFSARTSASFNPKIENWYRDQVTIAFRRIIEVVPKARLSYRHDGDLDSFLALAIQNIGDTLSCLASLIGHCDGLDKSFLDDEGQIAQILVELGLEKWIYIYQLDLDKLFCKCGKWSDVSELTALNIHIERLLWQFSVFPWRMDTGQIKIEIPLAVDMTELLKSVM